ncbi:protein SPEAR2-like [Apium graveolens]|uniref:protein SPEAR2-like n=1 Tax=Apium graveolens TaxID=4045 RepID=UPI003D7BAC7E
MAQEKQAQKYSNSRSGGANGGCGGGGGGGSSSARSCKKLKQKKIPQRGLGVAELERLRLEEQLKKNGLPLQPSAVLPSANSIVYMGNSCLHVPDVLLNDLQLPNPMRRQPGLILNGDAASNWGKHPDYHSFVVHPNENLPYETKTPVSLFPGIVYRSEQPCPFMVNAPSVSLKSSVSSLEIEPPLNKMYGANNCTPLWKEEERMVGLKRSYPFVVEDAPGPFFNNKHPPAYASLFPGKDEAALCSNDTESANALFTREFLLSSNGISELKNKKVTKESGGFDGNFLTLAPPREEILSSYLSRHYQEQDTASELIKWSEHGRSMQRPFYNFLPAASAVNGLPEGTANSNGKQGETVDLNLKL